MGIEREEYHPRMCDVHNRHSEWKARCSSVVFRAPSQPYVGAICSGPRGRTLDNAAHKRIGHDRCQGCRLVE